MILRREADTDGLPPPRFKVTSPYDTDTRWAVKGDDLFWNGYKVHLSETCDHDDEPDTAGNDGEPGPRPAPNLIVNVATTAATVPEEGRCFVDAQ